MGTLVTRGVFLVELSISLPSFNGPGLKLVKIALFIYLLLASPSETAAYFYNSEKKPKFIRCKIRDMLS